MAMSNGKQVQSPASPARMAVAWRELLLEKGYAVHGIKRRASSFNTTRIDHLIRILMSVVTKVSLHS